VQGVVVAYSHCTFILTVDLVRRNSCECRKSRYRKRRRLHLATCRSQRIDCVYLSSWFCGCGGGRRWENKVNGTLAVKCNILTTHKNIEMSPDDGVGRDFCKCEKRVWRCCNKVQRGFAFHMKHKHTVFKKMTLFSCPHYRTIKQFIAWFQLKLRMSKI